VRPGTEGGDEGSEVRGVDEVVDGRDIHQEVRHLQFKGWSPHYTKIIMGGEDTELVRVDA